VRLPVASLCLLALACAPAAADTAAAAIAGIDALNARLVDAYRTHDPQAYGARYTDSAVFEWPAFTTVRGPAALAEMARGNLAALREMDLRLTIADRRVAGAQATEFAAFDQS
jgi:ketosteroid isomerase-like protein